MEQTTSTKFYDARTHTKKDGQVLCIYTTPAYAASGDDKKRLIDLLLNQSAESAIQFAIKVLMADERSAVNMCIKIASDLKHMTIEEVEDKKYEFNLRALFFVDKDNVPDDPCWSVVDLIEK